MNSKSPYMGGDVKKQEDSYLPDDDKNNVKPNKPLNRVPRACNACRKQKMRCEGADNPPCRRCRHASLECLFEKPTREPNLTGEAGLQRIRALEMQVSEVRQSQMLIQNTLSELVNQLRTSSLPPPPPPLPHTNSELRNTWPRQPSSSSFPASTSTDGTSSIQSPMDPSDAHGYARSESTSTVMEASGQRLQKRVLGSNDLDRGSSKTSTPSLASQVSNMRDMSAYQRPGPANLSSTRYQQPNDTPTLYHPQQPYGNPSSSSSTLNLPNRSPKRRAGNSTVTSSSANSDVEDLNGELPMKGLVAPWEVLRGLADVAALRAAQENGIHSEPQSRGRSISPEGNGRKPAKRRKTRHPEATRGTFLDIVAKRLLSDVEGRELFKIFYAGCSTFLPVFDSQYDTYDALHERSPFAFNAICMVAAKVRDGGGNPSDTYRRCLEEVQAISCATLFSPVTRQEVVQAMVLVSGWSDNGWLSGGHAVRMAFELSMHQSWPKLLKRIQSQKASTSEEDRGLITSARTWFCLYLFEHQMSYGTGRPAILRDDESIWLSRALLQHPLAIEDDMRLCSMVELMAIRERIQNKLSLQGPVDERTFAVIQEADAEFRNWYGFWDNAFGQKYENAAFYRQSLQIQKHHAELFHNATALRGIGGPEDVQRMPPAQKALALASLQIAQHCLSLSVNSSSYREGLKYAVHYTHATATFTASFLLRLARLFPEHCDLAVVQSLVERLIEVLSEIPARRYASTLQLMLKKTKRRRTQSRSPVATLRPDPNIPTNGFPQQYHHQQRTDYSSQQGQQQGPPGPESPRYDRQPSSNNLLTPTSTNPSGAPAPLQMHAPPTLDLPHVNEDGANLDLIWRGFEGAANDQLPMWITDQSLGGNSISQLGLEAFMMPMELDHGRGPVPQIW